MVLLTTMVMQVEAVLDMFMQIRTNRSQEPLPFPSDLEVRERPECLEPALQMATPVVIQYLVR